MSSANFSRCPGLLPRFQGPLDRVSLYEGRSGELGYAFKTKPERPTKCHSTIVGLSGCRQTPNSRQPEKGSHFENGLESLYSHCPAAEPEIPGSAPPAARPGNASVRLLIGKPFFVLPLTINSGDASPEPVTGVPQNGASSRSPASFLDLPDRSREQSFIHNRLAGSHLSHGEASLLLRKSRGCPALLFSGNLKHSAIPDLRRFGVIPGSCPSI